MIGFTYGHEFAHLALGHLANSDEPASTPRGDLKTYAHALEFTADLHAVKSVTDRDERREYAWAAYDLFFYLHALEVISETYREVPRFSVSSTHPAPLDRLRALREGLRDKDQPGRWELGMGVKAVQDMSQLLRERISQSPRDDLLTFYGSIYLGGLGGRPRRDRIDF